MATYKKQLIEMITHDSYLLSILKAVEKLNLTDAWVCAGLIRNKVWDKLHNTTTPINDIDVIYFDTSDISLEIEKQLEKKLSCLLPNQPWTVKNQARMHSKSGFDPFTSSYDGVAHFPETPTAIAVRFYNKKIEIIAPHGLNDLFGLTVKPTPFYQQDSEFHSIYVDRIQNKKWKIYP
ncbi:protein of unknown function DUF925 [Carnobacterium sp. 17-4]|uniref:nucleotidyltransferase family protein n=1 Tax=Carnobacterium sp. (strain 17-4) TaxID=208596 RepID=UPI00020589BE|nr:nucleotidyltransferase family protein [Carnobacterium sp. 17-4]AEB28876.1 protein of unknown function DUF925 [Carnobacterium sp. 17-4]